MLSYKKCVRILVVYNYCRQLSNVGRFSLNHLVYTVCLSNIIAGLGDPGSSLGRVRTNEVERRSMYTFYIELIRSSNERKIVIISIALLTSSRKLQKHKRFNSVFTRDPKTFQFSVKGKCHWRLEASVLRDNIENGQCRNDTFL